jgi:adenine deaminase
MDFFGAAGGAPGPLAKAAVANEAGMIVDGHAPGLRGKALNAYLAVGPDSDHECTDLEEAREKLSRGMWVFLREGSFARNMEALAPLFEEGGGRRLCLVSDDATVETLLSRGHVDRLLWRAVSLGVPALEAIRAVTWNVAERFRLPRRGAVAPGYHADLVAVKDLEAFQVAAVWKGGEPIARDGELLAPLPRAEIRLGEGSVRLGHLDRDSFGLPAEPDEVIEIIPGELLTRRGEGGPDAIRLAVVERHKASGRVGLGWVRGLGPFQGALGSTVAHDSHNLVLAGTDAEDLLLAARTLEGSGGGLVVVGGGQVRAHLPLPIGGLMSNRSPVEVRETEQELAVAFRRQGGTLEHPFVALSFLTLPVIPEIKLTDRGIVRIGI